VNDIIKSHISDYVDENEELSLIFIDDEKDYIIEALNDQNQDKIEEIKYIFQGFNNNIESSFYSIELWEYLDIPKDEIIDFIFNIMKKRYIIDTL
jgi:hypothetical protein